MISDKFDFELNRFCRCYLILSLPIDGDLSLIMALLILRKMLSLNDLNGRPCMA